MNYDKAKWVIEEYALQQQHAIGVIFSDYEKHIMTLGFLEGYKKCLKEKDNAKSKSSE